MREVIYQQRPKKDERLIFHYPEDFNRHLFLGMETRNGARYFKSNWGTSKDNNIFWYPFVGGDEANVWNTIGNWSELQSLIKGGAKFFTFSSANEMYKWMSEGKE